MRKLALALVTTGALMLWSQIAIAASVSMVDSAFDPADVTVEAGETITWSNDGALPHTATADDGSFDTGTLDPGDSDSVRIDEPGTYPYYCTLHGAPGGIGMAGTITVAEGGGGGNGGRNGGLPQTASPLPLVAGAGLVLLIGGILLGRRARTR
ncbi:MAG TPA: plastocyanin/azurin family copper-binding protein [Actinomycetota bacterium]|nr:plastocyanin/azurin family copper-binding protein [Actinomycetota bacterium]